MIVASRMPVVTCSSANGYFSPPGLSANGLSDFGYFGSGYGFTLMPADRNSPPLRPQLPSSADSSATARLRCVSSPFQLTRRPGWMIVAGRNRANSRAVVRIIAASMPVSTAAHSGVYCPISATNLSKPWPYLSTKALSYRPSVTSTFIHASSSARSVPGLIGSQYFALLAATEKRGSTTMIGMRRSIAFANSCTWLLCMFSPRCEPISTRQSVFSMSVGSGEPRPAPKVSRKPMSRGPRHCANDGPA